MALAHSIKDKTEAAYRRGDLRGAEDVQRGGRDFGEGQRDEGRLGRFARIRRTTGESNKRRKAQHKGQESGQPKAQGKSFFHSSTSFEFFIEPNRPG